MMLDIPEGYAHKATSEGFNGSNSVEIYRSVAVDRYLVVLRSNVDEDTDDVHMFISKGQLELLVQSATDTLEMDSR